MKSKPWIAVNVLTNETLGNYTTEFEALSYHKGQPVDVIYAPNAREVK